MRHKSKNAHTTSAWYSVILESDLADIDKETTLTANTLSNKEKGAPQEIRRGSSFWQSQNHNSIRRLISVVYSFKVTKNSKGCKVTYLQSSSDSESDDPERHAIARGQVKTLAHKLQQQPNKYPVDTAKMNLPLPDTISEYLLSFIFTRWRTEHQLNTVRTK